MASSTQGLRYAAKRTPAGWFVMDRERGQKLERHVSEERAVNSAKRLNGICLHCDRPLAECKIENPRDEGFGAEYDDSETET